MGIAQIPAPSGGLAVARFPARSGAPFNIPAGLTLQNTVTSTTTFSAGQLPAQVWAVIVGGGGSGGVGAGSPHGGGGGGGGVVIGWVDVPSTGITATIGGGGNSSNGTGNRGGITYFGSHWAQGGGGGATDGTGILDHNQLPRFGPGQPGYGGNGGSTVYNGTNSFVNAPVGAPIASAFDNGNSAITFSVGASSIAGGINLTSNNYLGGGAGGCRATWSTAGGSGYTGGGGSASQSGGNSSRDGGLTNTFTGGTGATGSGGGAGFLANGSNSPGTAGGAGGSGGGGGGSAGSGANSGAGGNGCVLIYY